MFLAIAKIGENGVNFRRVIEVNNLNELSDLAPSTGLAGLAPSTGLAGLAPSTGLAVLAP